MVSSLLGTIRLNIASRKGFPKQRTERANTNFQLYRAVIFRGVEDPELLLSHVWRTLLTNWDEERNKMHANQPAQPPGTMVNGAEGNFQVLAE